jgi:hypothetical protein
MIARIYKRLLQIGKVSGAVAFLIAAPYALFQYIQTKEHGRIEQTLSLFKMYNSSPFTGYRERITKALTKNKKKINDASKEEATFQALQFDIIQQEDIETELLLLFDFFDSVTVCVTSSLCDNDTAIKLFKPRALDIYMNFYQYMVAQRGSTTTRAFGSGVEAIARSGKPIMISNADEPIVPY